MNFTHTTMNHAIKRMFALIAAGIISTGLLVSCSDEGNSGDMLLFGLAMDGGTIPSETSDDSGSTEGSTTLPVSETVNADVPDNYTPETSPEGDFEGILFEAGDEDAEGFIAEVEPAGNASDLMDRILSRVNTEYGSENVSLISRKAIESSPMDTQIANLEVDFSTASTATEVRNMLIELIGMVDGSGTVTNFPGSGEGEITSTSFRFVIQASEESGSAVVMVGVTPVEKYSEVEENLTTAIDGTNVGLVDWEKAPETATFVGTGVAPEVNIMFAMDNSGSMTEEQWAVVQKAVDFFDRLNTLGLTFSIATVTSDDSSINGNAKVKDTGDNCKTNLGIENTYTRTGFTSDRTEFEKNVCTGIDGSGSESGLYFAEQAFKTGGSALNAGYPHAGAATSVIVVTDENDMYETKNGSALDLNSNAFVDNDITVYGIIPLDNNGQATSQAKTDCASVTLDQAGGSWSVISDLATKTGGGVSSICGSKFGEFLLEVADQEAAKASPFKLAHTPISTTLKITVDGKTIYRDLNPEAGQTGYKYNSATNSVAFTGVLPGSGSSILVEYMYYVK